MKSSEAVEQQHLFQWAAFAAGRYPELRFMFHVPNGGSRNKAEAAHLKAQGVKAGVPDICLPVPRAGKHGLWIELKAGKNKTTERQDAYLEFLKEQHYHVAVCYGWEEAREVILEYLGGNRNEKDV